MFNYTLWFCILKSLKSLQNVPKSPKITPGAPKIMNLRRILFTGPRKTIFLRCDSAFVHIAGACVFWEPELMWKNIHTGHKHNAFRHCVWDCVFWDFEPFWKNCRSLLKVKFSTGQFRPALGSCCCSIDWLIYCPLLLYTDLVPPSTDPVPPSTNQYRPIVTQYHRGSKITVLYWSTATKHQ